MAPSRNSDDREKALPEGLLWPSLPGKIGETTRALRQVRKFPHNLHESVRTGRAVLTPSKDGKTLKVVAPVWLLNKEKHVAVFKPSFSIVLTMGETMEATKAHVEFPSDLELMQMKKKACMFVLARCLLLNDLLQAPHLLKPYLLKH